MSHSVTTLAERAVTAAHQLAHLARPAITTLDVADLRTVAAALAELAAGLPQTLNQLSTYLDAADNLTATDGRFTGDPTTAAHHARTRLRHAAAAAAHLATALDAAHQTLGDIAETTEPDQGGQFSTGEKGSIFGRR